MAPDTFRSLMKVGRSALRSLALGLAVTSCALPATAFAQETRGTITGTVRDASGAVIAGAEILVARAGTGVQTQLTTNEEGFFSIPYLIAGAYQISVTRSGFKKYVKENLRVAAEGRHSLDVVLEPGAVTEQITVVGGAIEVDTASATGATVLNQELVAELPLYGGNANRLAALAPGVHSTGPFIPISGHDIRPQVAVTVAGGVGFPEFAVDGIANRNEGSTPPASNATAINSRALFTCASSRATLACGPTRRTRSTPTLRATSP